MFTKQIHRKMKLNRTNLANLFLSSICSSPLSNHGPASSDQKMQGRSRNLIKPGALKDNAQANKKVVKQENSTKKISTAVGRLENAIGFNKNFICCKESRIESPTSFYGCFYVGPFDESLAQTLAHNLRRTLLSELTGLAITAVEIDGVFHQFSSIPGTKETVLDILCNLQNIVLSGFDTAVPAGPLSEPAIQTRAKSQDLCRPTNGITQIAYLRVRGPGVVKASDIILPAGVNCVSSEQYIATLAEDGILNMKLYINEGKNAIKQNQNLNNARAKDPLFLFPQTTLVNGTKTNLSKESVKNPLGWSGATTHHKNNKIFLDSVFMPVTKVNAFVETNFKATDALQSEVNTSQINKESKPNYAFKSEQKSTKFVKQNFMVLSNTNNNTLLQENELLQSGSLGENQNKPLISPDIANTISEGPFSLIKATRQSHIVLEIWTNGSVHPRQALKSSLDFLTTTFMTLNNVKVLGSMYKSDITYKQILQNMSTPEIVEGLQSKV